MKEFGDLVLAILLIVGGIFTLGRCAHFAPDPPAKAEEADGALSWKMIEWSIDSCKKNSGVKRIYVSGKVICTNGARFLPPKPQAKNH